MTTIKKTYAKPALATLSKDFKPTSSFKSKIREAEINKVTPKIKDNFNKTSDWISKNAGKAGDWIWKTLKGTAKSGWEATKWTGNSLKNPAVGKTVGISAMLIALYSIAKDGYRKGNINTNAELGKDYANLFTNLQSSARHSNLLTGAKNTITDLKFNNSMIPFYKKVKNMAFSMTGEVFNNGITLGLAAGAAIVAPLLASVGAPVVAGVVGGVCAGVLLFRGAKFLVYDVLGVGK